MSITDLTEDDLPALASLYKGFWGEESSVDKMKSTFAKLKNNPDYTFLTARLDEQIVGSVMGIVCYELYGECKPFMVVENMIIDKNVRRQGVGSQLIVSIEEKAKERGCCHIILVTETNRYDACPFYESLGFDPDKNKGFKKKL
ncbi:MAG: GNAT family N-acetyltransferase [Kiritimatiellaceae bacterium]|nr:GNAT family N-acetyltransferase [Kiritimatiellaceae bacterium]